MTPSTLEPRRCATDTFSSSCSMDKPRREATDSPSRQLLLEQSRLQYVQEQREREELLRLAENLTLEHRQSLEAADEQHRKLRESARNALEAHELQLSIDAENRRREEVEKLERLRRERAEREADHERRKLEEARAAEAAERAAEVQRRQREQEAERARQEKERQTTEELEARRAAEQNAQAAKNAAEAKAKEAAINAFNSQKAQQVQQAQQAQQVQQAQQAQFAVPQQQNATASAPPTSIPNLAQKELEHNKYLQIHRNLKELRSTMKQQVQSDPNAKRTFNDGRRTIQKCVSQIVMDNVQNKGPQAEILKTLRSALQFPNPQVKVTDYLLNPPANAPDPNGPGMLLYFLNILSKNMIRQWLNESNIDTRAADPVGILASSMFAQTDLCWNGTPLIDILLAKFHKHCPVLFGIYGLENTSGGMARLGWQVIPGRGYCPEQRHTERMTGLGAGYASVTLRNFDKSRMSHPCPPYHFWQSMANILNVPPDKVTRTHLSVLKGMLESSWKRIFDAFGDAAGPLLRLALEEYPNKSKEAKSSQARILVLIPDVWKKEHKLYL